MDKNNEKVVVNGTIVNEYDNVETAVVKKEETAVTYNFERIDLDNPITILNYGDEPKNDIEQILSTTSRLTSDVEELMLDDKVLNLIVNFDETLDESEKFKKKKISPTRAKIRNFLTSLGVTKYEEEKKANSYNGKLDEYHNAVEYVVGIVESKMQAALVDINLRQSIISEMEPKIKMLDEIIRVGLEDLETLRREISELEAGPDKSDEMLRYINRRKQEAALINDKLNKLEKASLLYKNQIESFRVQQNTEMTLVMEQQSYIKDQAPVLKAQGTVMVYNKKQQERIQTQMALNEASNAAIQNNAKALEQNVEDVVDLTLNSGISMDTLNVYASSLQRGIQLLHDSKDKKQQINETERQAIQGLSSALQEFDKELYEYAESLEAFTEATKNIKTLGKRNVYKNR